MQTSDDMELLKAYATGQSEEAFAALVSRHINLVYWAALRQVGNAQLAEEISQAVFVILARKARALRQGTVLSGWLYETARLTAANSRRSEARRMRREQEAQLQSISTEPEPDSSWAQVRPLLEEAMSGLSQKDRDAIILRYFEDKPIREIGAALGASEDAAKMRISRALDKLREFFVKRGVSITSAGLAAVITENSALAAPAGLAGTVTAAALGSAALSASTLTLAKGTFTMMTWTKINIGITTVALAMVAYQWNEASAAKQQAADLSRKLQDQAKLFADQQEETAKLQKRNDDLAWQIKNTAHEAAQTAATKRKSAAALAGAAGTLTGGGGNSGGGGGALSGDFLAKMMKNPGMREMMKAQQKIVMKSQYGELVKKLGLSPDQTDQFYQIMMDGAMANIEKGSAMLAGGDKTAIAQAIADSQKDQDAQLQTLLGNDGFAQYQDYKKSLPDRTLLDQMKSDFGDHPLTDDQQAQLLQAMMTERQNAGALSNDKLTQLPITDRLAAAEQQMEQQETINERVRDDAAAFLSPEQIQTLGSAQSNFLNLSKASLSMAQAFLGTNNPAPTQ